MNSIFRVVYNRATNRWVVASELAKGRVKSKTRKIVASTLIGSLLLSGSAFSFDISEKIDDKGKLTYTMKGGNNQPAHTVVLKQENYPGVENILLKYYAEEGTSLNPTSVNMKFDTFVFDNNSTTSVIEYIDVVPYQTTSDILVANSQINLEGGKDTAGIKGSITTSISDNTKSISNLMLDNTSIHNKGSQSAHGIFSTPTAKQATNNQDGILIHLTNNSSIKTEGSDSHGIFVNNKNIHSITTKINSSNLNILGNSSGAVYYNIENASSNPSNSQLSILNNDGSQINIGDASNKTKGSKGLAIDAENVTNIQLTNNGNITNYSSSFIDSITYETIHAASMYLSAENINSTVLQNRKLIKNLGSLSQAIYAEVGGVKDSLVIESTETGEIQLGEENSTDIITGVSGIALKSSSTNDAKLIINNYGSIHAYKNATNSMAINISSSKADNIIVNHSGSIIMEGDESHGIISKIDNIDANQSINIDGTITITGKDSSAIEIEGKGYTNLSISSNAKISGNVNVSTTDMQFHNAGNIIGDNTITTTGSTNLTNNTNSVINGALIVTAGTNAIINNAGSFVGNSTIDGQTAKVENSGNISGNLAIKTSSDMKLTNNTNSVINGVLSVTAGTNAIINNAGSFIGNSTIDGQTAEIENSGNINGDLAIKTTSDMKLTNNAGAIVGGTLKIDAGGDASITNNGIIKTSFVASNSQLTRAITPFANSINTINANNFALDNIGELIGNNTINAVNVDFKNSGSILGNTEITTSTNTNFANTGLIDGNIKIDSEDYTFDNDGSIFGSINIISSKALNFTNKKIFALKDPSDVNSPNIKSDFGGNTYFINTGTVGIHSFHQNGAPNNAVLTGINEFRNSGIIDLSNMKLGSSSNTTLPIAGDTLKIDGKFITNGGQIVLDTLLSGTSGTSDQLILNETVTGTAPTAVYVNILPGSAGGILAGDGVNLIQVDGGKAKSNGLFQLANNVTVDAYEYRLTQGKMDGNWYLSNMIENPTLPTGPEHPMYRPDAGINLANRESVIDMMVPGFSGNSPNGVGGSGAMRATVRMSAGVGDYGAQKSNSLWTFSTASDNHGRAVNGKIKYSYEAYSQQVGGDHSILLNNGGLLQIGAMAHLSTSNTRSRSLLTGTRVTGSSDGYGFGAYATWFAKADDILSPFVDTYAMYGRYKNTVKDRNYMNDVNYKSDAYSITLHGGYPIAINDSILIEPQAQLTYVHYGSDSYIDHSGTKIDLSTDGEFIGRVGAYIYGHSYLFQPYAAVNVWYDSTRSETRYNSNSYNPYNTISGDKRGAIFEAKVGFQTQATRDLTWWGEISGRAGDNSYSHYGGAMGIKYSW